MLAAGSAAGQVNPTVPTREEIERVDRRDPPPRSRLTVEGDVERSPCALADPAYRDIRVTLSAAEFANLGPVDAAMLAPAWTRFAGSEHPISVVCEIRDAAATILRRAGYLAAVQVPTQRIEDGRVRFEILFARVTALRVRGDAGGHAGALEAYLRHLSEQPVFNRRQAERYLLLARDLPGLDVRLALRPAGTGPGEMIGEVTVRRTPFELAAIAQNLAPSQTGAWGGQFVAQAYGLTGLGDRTTLSVYSTADFREQQVAQLGHEMRIGGEGLRLSANLTYAWTRPDLGAATPDVDARTFFANFEAAYPIVRRQAWGIGSAVGVDLVNQRVRFGALPLSRDRLRVGYARLDGYALDLAGLGPKGTSGYRIDGSVELRRGLSIAGASANCLAAPAACTIPPSLIDGDPTATVVRGQIGAELRFAESWTVVAAARGQASSAALFAFEQISAGNYTIGRGYDPGALTGDSGILYSAEIRRDPWRLSQKAELFAQPYVFADSAWIWNRNAPPGRDPERLSSFGGGVRLNWADRARLDLGLAFPTRRVGGSDRDVRFLMSLSTRLLPWRTR